MRWFFNNFNPVPYSDLHSLNLDWILSEITKIRKEWEDIKDDWEQMKTDWSTFQTTMQRLWSEYKNLMDAAYDALRDEWVDYREGLDSWKAGVDQSLSDFQAAWVAYRQDVDSDLDSMQTQMDNFISSMETYITQNLPAIVSPIVRDWLDEHGITVSAFIRPEDEGGLVNAFAKATIERVPVLLTTGETYDTGSNTLTIPAGITLLGSGATIASTTATNIVIESNARIYDLNISQLGTVGNYGSVRVAGGNVVLDTVSIDSDIPFYVGKVQSGQATEYISNVSLDRCSYSSLNVAYVNRLYLLNLITAPTITQTGTNTIYTSTVLPLT